MDTPINDQPISEEVPQAEDALAKAERECAEYLAGWQRTKADFINYKKDEMKRLEEISRYQTEDLIKEFISVMDNFELGIASLEKKGPVEKGIYMIKTQIEDILKKRGLTRIPIRAGDMFDPVTSEAIAETESELPSGSVVEEIEAGYKMQDKVVRPARVKIAK